jgi:hypothetical protein
MAVPDWPNTYGYNMFFFPVSKWIGGIFFEHTHRLVRRWSGFLTTILAFGCSAANRARCCAGAELFSWRRAGLC